MPFRNGDPMPGASLFALAALVLGLGLPRTLTAQEPAEAATRDALRVYLDCQRFRYCERDHFRREIPWVSWVREPQDAQVHLILTSQGAGGGGSQLTVDFIGREELEGIEDRYEHSVSTTDVPDEAVAAVTRLLRRGLVRYTTLLGGEVGFEIRPLEGVEAEAGDGPAGMTPQDDPWDFWVFDIDASVDFEEEKRTSSRELDFGVGANRTTDEWKINMEVEGRFSREEFELDEGTVENDQDHWSAEAFAVRSVGGHAGVGLAVEGRESTRLNQELLLAVGSGVEWNYFPYDESNRRVLLARYVVSAERVSYQDTTVFDVLVETVFRHEVGLDYEAREPWGNANIGVNASHFLDRTDFYSVGMRLFLRYRLFRGFSVNLRGNYSIVRDQIYLPKEELRDEDILLGRRALPTDSEVGFQVGVGYSFGSIFNNVVNPRFRFGVR